MTASPAMFHGVGLLLPSQPALPGLTFLDQYKQPGSWVRSEHTALTVRVGKGRNGRREFDSCRPGSPRYTSTRQATDYWRAFQTHGFYPEWLTEVKFLNHRVYWARAWCCTLGKHKFQKTSVASVLSEEVSGGLVFTHLIKGEKARRKRWSGQRNNWSNLFLLCLRK